MNSNTKTEDNPPKNDSIDVSIIIPAYNSDKYIEKCLNTARKQTLKNIEIICIDDASTDKTLEIINNHVRFDKRVCVFTNTTNLGPGASRNIGIKHARGKYITFLDADDWLDENTLECVLKKSEENNLDLLLFKLINMNNITKLLYKTETYSMNFLEKYYNRVFNHDDISANILFKIPVTAPGKLYLRSFLLENNIRFNETTMYEDNPFFIKTFLKARRVSVVDEYFYKRRVHSDSLTSNTKKDMMDIHNVLDEIFSILKSNDSYYMKYKLSFYDFMIHTLLNRFQKIDNEFKNDFFNKTKSLIEKYIVEYDLNDDIKYNLSKNNLRTYNLIVKSMNSENNIIKDIQENISLNTPIASIVYCDDITVSRLNEILNSFINQTMGFSYLDIIFISSTKRLKDVQKLLKIYDKTYYNIHYIQLEEDMSLLDIYSIGINMTDCSYITLLDKNHVYKDHVLKNLFRNMKENEYNMAHTNINDYNKKYMDLEIWNKMFTKKFLVDNQNIFFKTEKNTYLINPLVYLKKGIMEPENLNQMALVYDMLKYCETNKNEFIKQIDFMMDILQSNFKKIEHTYKNSCFIQIQAIVECCIIKYELNDIIIKNISKEHREFYNYVISSLKSKNYPITKLQKNIIPNRPVTVVVKCDKYSIDKINRVVSNLINQSFGFSFIEVLFVIEYASKNSDVEHVIKNYTKIYPNIEYMVVDNNLDEDKLYNKLIDDIDTQFVMFYNKKYSYIPNTIKYIFRTVRKGNMHVASGIIEDSGDDSSNELIWTKIFKIKFLKEANIKFYMKENDIFVEKRMYNRKGIVNVPIIILKKE